MSEPRKARAVEVFVDNRDLPFVFKLHATEDSAAISEMIGMIDDDQSVLIGWELRQVLDREGAPYFCEHVTPVIIPKTRVNYMKIRQILLADDHKDTP